MAFDRKQLTRLDWGVVGGAAVALVSLFLPWYGVSVAGFSASISGWNTGYGWIADLLLVAAGAWYFMWKAKVELPKTPLSPLAITVATAAAGLLLVILRWASLPRGHSGLLGTSFDYGPRAGIWIALIAGIVELVCAAIVFARSGEPLPWRTGSGPAGPPV